MTKLQFPIFVNGEVIQATEGEALSGVLARVDTELLAVLMDPDGMVTDARGLPVEPDSPVHGGAIYRIRRSARREGSADA